MICIVSFTVMVELHSVVDFDENYASFISVDILKLFSSALIFSICIWKKDILVNLNENYNEVENVLVQSEDQKVCE